jgi:predicted DNA-binding mobile mystery protein A
MFNSLSLPELDKALEPWRALPRALPRDGWLRAIRQVMGKTTRQGADAVGVTQSALVDAERNEARGDITLTTLRRYAAALDCQLFYALVPNRPLHEIVENRADQIAREQLVLEPPGSVEQSELEIAALKKRLLEGKRSRLWR